MTPNIQRLEHVGWVTDDRAKFESFWVDIIGLDVVKEAEVSDELTRFLFGVAGGAKVVRYALHSQDAFEIHVFDRPMGNQDRSFACFGINHICLRVADKTKFLHNLPLQVTRKVFQNPGGWTNVFLKDFEGNWVEIRE